MIRPAVLFVRADSVYKRMDCDAWDAERNALNWPGGAPVVTHPPCAVWGEMSHMARTAREGDRGLGLWAVDQVRTWGGVLENPKRSKLWPAAGLPVPGERDSFGGFTFAVPQFWFGHGAEKWTWLYICGIHPSDLPPVPFRLGEAPCIIGTPGRRVDGSRLKRGEAGWRPEVSKAEREHTPPAFAAWLLLVATLCWKPERRATA